MVQSTFYSDLSKYKQRNRFGLTGRQVWIGIKMIPPMAIIFVPWLVPVSWFLLLGAEILGSILLIPLLLQFLGQYQKMKREYIDFRTIIKERKFRSNN